jgi:ABC-2 type transport system permease protein
MPAGPISVNGMPALFFELMFAWVLYGLTSVVIFFYLADCLYAERKDRSILFWKSLPVSDSATVLTKALVALLIVPLGLFVLAFVTNLIAYAILWLRLHNNAALAPLMTWDTVEWLRLNGALLLAIPILALWYAPIAAYQLLVSAWAKGSVFVWTVLPPLVLILGERFTFGTWYIRNVLRDRLGLSVIGVAARGRASNTPFGQRGLFDGIDVIGLLSSLDMWIGVAIAVAFVLAAIRIRRYRDDS